MPTNKHLLVIISNPRKLLTKRKSRKILTKYGKTRLTTRRKIYRPRIMKERTRIIPKIIETIIARITASISKGSTATTHLLIQPQKRRKFAISRKIDDFQSIINHIYFRVFNIGKSFKKRNQSIFA